MGATEERQGTEGEAGMGSLTCSLAPPSPGISPNVVQLPEPSPLRHCTAQPQLLGSHVAPHPAPTHRYFPDLLELAPSVAITEPVNLEITPEERVIIPTQEIADLHWKHYVTDPWT